MEKQMRIGIDGHVMGKGIGGVERFVRELVNKLPTKMTQHHFVVFVTKDTFNSLKQSSIEQLNNVEYVPLLLSNPLFERLFLLPWLVYKHRLDGLLVQRISPWFCGRCKLIVTIHDLTPIKFSKAYKGLSNHLVRLLTKNTINRADLILTPTLAIKKEIEQYCPKAKAPIRAFYNGVDVSTFSQAEIGDRPLINKPYLLTVGAIERRKNIEVMIDIIPALKVKPEMKLYIVGKVRDAEYANYLKDYVASKGLSHRVVWVDYIAELDLINYYQHAELFITASLDEGFNIPPLEAMACGTPAICSDIAVHQELFVGGAIFFKVDSAPDLLSKVEQLLLNPSLMNDMKLKGHQKVAEFTWDRTATNVADAIAEVA